jgi:hypothetical protein
VVALYSTNIQSLWDCPVRDMILVEREMEIIESPVRDAMDFYRTTMIKDKILFSAKKIFQEFQPVCHTYNYTPPMLPTTTFVNKTLHK